MDTLFSADSVLMRGLTRIADVMILNLVFVVTSLPVVTLGASLTALNFTAMRIGTGECGSVTSDYFRSFRQNFRQATIVGLVLVALGCVLAAWYAVLSEFALDALSELLLLAVWYVLAFSVAITALFAFPYLANFSGRTRDVLRNALLLSWRHLPTSLAVLALLTLCVGVTLFFPQASGYGLAWLMIGFGGVAVANGFLFSRVFSTYATASISGEA